MMQYQFYALSDPGRVRANNEDALAFHADTAVAVLADGMGGYNAGEVASSMTVNLVLSELTRWRADPATKPSLLQAVHALEMSAAQANLSVLNAALFNPQYAGMGTTLVVGLFLGATLVLGHVGDSRCYRWRAGTLTQLTRDHSMLQEQVDAGLITPAQAAVMPGKNLLTRALGVEDSLQIEVHVHPVQAGDLYLMCSDGLTDMVNDSQLAQVLASPSSLAQMAAELVMRANVRGGRDNISVLLTQAGAADEKSGVMSG